METLRQLQEDKTCFDCHEKGRMYCVMAQFGVIVCSTCAEVHREFNHKVKGIFQCRPGREATQPFATKVRASEMKEDAHHYNDS